MGRLHPPPGVGVPSGHPHHAQSSPARLGVLGGTFNPPHVGHLALARHALRELGLERILLMPARLSPGKPAEEEPNPARPEHRLEMCRLAAAGVEGVGACALELERDGPSYTVDTLRALHASHPNHELMFILGADVARTLPSWREAPALPALARFAVALRPGTGPAEVREALAALSPALGGPLPGEPRPSPAPNPSPAVTFLTMPTCDVSSSLVRDRVRRGLSVDELVGPAVAAYVAAHDLYRVTRTEAPAP